ncbi:MAG: ABC transporter ATP-binding protein [Anaerolineales bacterium]|nr:ABC transporter ATP-binding protein [Anaerolineales bacterium]
MELAQNGMIIEAKGVTKQFGNEVAVQDITFEIPQGTIFGFIGPSGCGKTTTVRLLTGLYEPSAGEVWVLGKHPKKFSQHIQRKIGYMPQLFALYQDLSVWENINFAASLYGVSLRRGRRLNHLLDFVELNEHKHKLARNISGGMQRRLSLAAALVHNPELIFLDEPTAGIDPVLRRKFWDHFKELQNQGRTLFVTTQYVGEAAYCDYVGVLSQGRLLMIETPDGLRQRAFGGEVVDLRTAERIGYGDLQQLYQVPGVQGEIQRIDNSTIRLTVDEASTAMPALLEWCQAQNLKVESIQEYLPPFDDVFVELVKKETPNE